MIINFSGELIDFFKKTQGCDSKRAICPSCGYEFENYLQSHKLGCSVCYDVFHDEIARQVAEWN
ncbi:MAG: hypothetical protein LBG88_00805 [Christensenellaceae bacterium]|nr:hypothetical protein [Christensenellaceae bacterium]